MTDEELYQIFAEHTMEPSLQELYQMSLEQENEMIKYGWRPCGKDEIETKQPMIVWVSELDMEVFKESLDVSKEFCGRLDENGKTLDRGLNFHMYRGQHFALSMSMQAVEINKDRVFKTGEGLYWIKINMWGSMKLAVLAYPEDGSDPITNMVLEAPLLHS